MEERGFSSETLTRCLRFWRFQGFPLSKVDETFFGGHGSDPPWAAQPAARQRAVWAGRQRKGYSSIPAIVATIVATATLQ